MAESLQRTGEEGTDYGASRNERGQGGKFNSEICECLIPVLSFDCPASWGEGQDTWAADSEGIVGGPFFVCSVAEQEFAGVEQRPLHVLPCLGAILPFRNVCQGRFDLAIGWPPRERRQI
jgi:hypothetical protein